MQEVVGRFAPLKDYSFTDDNEMWDLIDKYGQKIGFDKECQAFIDKSAQTVWGLKDSVL